MAKKEFTSHLAELGDFFTTSCTAKKLEFEKEHFKEIKEDLRLENLTNSKLKIKIDNHELLKHPRSAVLKPKEVKHIVLKIPCKKIIGKHKSYLILSSKNQTTKIPVKITHSE